MKKNNPISSRRPCLFLRIILVSVLLFACGSLVAAPTPPPTQNPGISLSFQGFQTPGGIALPIQMVFLLTLLALGPALVMCLSCFTRIIIVLHFLRQAIGTMNMPPNQVLVGLSLFLTLFIMSPVVDQIWTQALSPAMDGTISYNDAFEKGSVPLRQFMARYTRPQDVALFLSIGHLPKPKNIQEVPMRVIIPAFMISELKTAFQIGFVLYLPFVVVDILISSILLSTGMMMLPPVVISTPFKILLFVMVDGWNLVVGSLVKSFF